MIRSAIAMAFAMADSNAGEGRRTTREGMRTTEKVSRTSTLPKLGITAEPQTLRAAPQGKATPDSQRFRIRLAGWSQRLPAPLERPHPTRTPPGAAKSSPNKERGQA